MDINERLSEIILKYDLDEPYPAYRGYVTAHRLIDDLICSWNGKRIVCICNSVVSRCYFENRISDDREVDFIVFQKGELEKGKANEIVSGIEHIRDKEYDEICIISYNGEAIIGHYLRRLGLKYMWIYDYFAESGLYLDREWFDFLHDKDGVIAYKSGERLSIKRNPQILEYYDLRLRLESISCNESSLLKIIIVKKLIFVSLFIHDFIEADSWFDEYISISGDEKYIKAKRQIHDLLDVIKFELAQRAGKDIIIHWIDKVPYKDLKYADFLNNDARQSGLFFTNMYTMSPFTVPSIIQMFGEREPVDDGGWGDWFVGNKSITDWKVIKDIELSGYRFISLSRDFRSIPRRCISVEPIDHFSSSSDLLWYSISHVLSSHKPAVVFSHIAIETHDPFWSCRMDDGDIYDNDNRYIKGIKEVDEQLRFYSQLYNKELISIYLSDHGKEDYQSRFHPFFVICARELYQPKIVDNLLCWLDFGNIIRCLLKGEEIPFEKMERSYVRLQEYSWLDGNAQIDAFRTKGLIEGFVCGFRGAINKEYIYIKFDNGVEWLKKYDEDKQIFEPTWFQREDDMDPISQEELDALREQAGKNECNNLELYYKYNRYSQTVFRKAYSHEIRKIDLLNLLFEGFDLDKVYLRMGGIHSFFLYSVLTQNNREKITAIIDQNNECYCKRLGIPIISQIPVRGIVILSSFKYLDELVEEAKNYIGVKTINIYGYLKENGYHCRFPVYNFEPNPDEYEVGFPFDDFE